MTTINELQASRVKWKRLRRFAYYSTFAAVLVACSTYVLVGRTLFLDADGFVTRCKVAVASPWPDARVRQIAVRPGDWVEVGEKIAIVESATMSRSLADLAIETARVTSRLAQLDARSNVVKALLPLGRANADETSGFLEILKDAQSRGFVVDRSMQQMTNAKLQAMDRLLTLQAEETSLNIEINSNRGALKQVSRAYEDVRRMYGSGTLTAPASGFIGSQVAMVGEVLDTGRADVANIYTGSSYVIAYVPESYLFDVEEGENVSVRGRGQVIAGRIEKVLPITEALPPEFQLPNRVRGRGQLVRVAFSGRENFAVDEKINLSTCQLNSCKIGVSAMIHAAFTTIAWSSPPDQTQRGGSIANNLGKLQNPPRSAEEVASPCALRTVDNTASLPSTQK